MRQSGMFAMIAATLLAAQMGCHGGKNDVKGPTGTGDGDKEQITQGEQTGCDSELALECADGMVDGCSSQLTTVHICMPTEEQASQPCEQEIARQCAEGLVDACLMDPPAAATHVCVSAAEPAQPEPPTDEPDGDQPTPESSSG